MHLKKAKGQMSLSCGHLSAHWKTLCWDSNPGLDVCDWSRYQLQSRSHSRHLRTNIFMTTNCLIICRLLSVNLSTRVIVLSACLKFSNRLHSSPPHRSLSDVLFSISAHYHLIIADPIKSIICIKPMITTSAPPPPTTNS